VSRKVFVREIINCQTFEFRAKSVFSSTLYADLESESPCISIFLLIEPFSTLCTEIYSVLIAMKTVYSPYT